MPGPAGPLSVLAPVPGRALPLAEVPDPVFAGEMVGPGTAIDPPRGPVEALAPVDGRILKLHPHAYVVVAEAGRAVLVHLGIDTVQLHGEGFSLLAAEGDQRACPGRRPSARTEPGGRPPPLQPGRRSDYAELPPARRSRRVGGAMDVPRDQSTRTSGARLQVAVGALRSPARRRPTGEPPPLPHHLQTSGVGWLVAAIVLVALAIVVFVRGMRGPAIAVTVADDAVVRWLNGLDAPWFVAVMRVLAALCSWWVLNILLAGLIVTLLVLRRFRHLIIFLILANVVTSVAYNMGAVAQRPRPFGVEIGTGWGGWAMPSVQLTALSAMLVSMLYTLVPEGRWRNVGKWAVTALVALAALGRIALGADAPTDVLVGVAIGVTLPLLAFRLFAPNEVFPITYRRGRSAHLDVSGARGAAIRKGLEDQLGLAVEEVKPFGLAGSAGSTPLRIKLEGEPPTYLFGKLYARSHLRADRWYKLGRELMYGRLEDEKPFNSVRRLVQQEDYALRLCRDAGLPSPTPFGFVELTPDREYLLVTEFFQDAVELGEAEVDDRIIDDGLRIVRQMWDAGLAHRDVKPANLLVRNGRMRLIDVAFVETRPSPWRQAVDLANMMLCLALRSSPEQVYQRSLGQFTVDEVTEGFAAARGLALPSQLRRMLREKGRDLHEDFIRLLPSPPQPIRIQRWSARRVALWALVIVLLAVLGRNVVSNASNAISVETPLDVGNLACTHFEPLWLQAQAVPSASMVPCLRAELAGWEVGKVTVDDGRSVITLNHDRAGNGAVVLRLTATCDPGRATEMGSPAPGVVRYERLDQLSTAEFEATWFDRFPGGCVTYRLHSTDDVEGRFAAEAPALVGFVGRPALQQELERRSAGRLQFDPS
jgi:tRNA A-37 threonylcarbamoyl transferase component Bud32/membrane-associated phospholipid phosphatase